MTIQLENIISYLGQPLKKCGDELIWKCPYCEDKSQNNLTYNIKKEVFWCFASGGEHSKLILSEICKNSPDKSFIKPKTITEPIKKTLSPDTIKQFTSNMQTFNSELLKMPEVIKFLENKRGISIDTIKDCFIGIDRANSKFTFPTFEYMTNSVIGFEFRPLNFKKHITRAKGGITGIAQINTYTKNRQVLAILGGYLDCYLFYQYLKEIGQADFYHIVTSSNGEGATLNYLERIQEHFNKYKKIYLYLDTDKTGIEQMEKIKSKYPYIEMKIMNCGCKDFNEHYLRCIKPKMHMPQTDLSEVSKPVDIKPYTNLLELNTSHSDDLKEYKINPQTYKLIIDNKFYDIPRFFNINGAIEGNYKALDYIFSYCGFDIKRFMVKRE